MSCSEQPTTGLYSFWDHSILILSSHLCYISQFEVAENIWSDYPNKTELYKSRNFLIWNIHRSSVTPSLRASVICFHTSSFCSWKQENHALQRLKIIVAAWTMHKQPQQSGLRGLVRKYTASRNPSRHPEPTAWVEGRGGREHVLCGNYLQWC
jgi:hypothetical protein